MNRSRHYATTKETKRFWRNGKRRTFNERMWAKWWADREPDGSEVVLRAGINEFRQRLEEKHHATP